MGVIPRGGPLWLNFLYAHGGGGLIPQGGAYTRDFTVVYTYYQNEKYYILLEYTTQNSLLLRLFSTYITCSCIIRTILLKSVGGVNCQNCRDQISSLIVGG